LNQKFNNFLKMIAAPVSIAMSLTVLISSVVITKYIYEVSKADINRLQDSSKESINRLQDDIDNLEETVIELQFSQQSLAIKQAMSDEK